ncbi:MULTISPECIES: DUF6912 family protein [unclassified Phycicoccus]|uniref:DUF6912 family protein n=1 Tax=unclassified Phycicoccus TaxID=2637926 RepID=UPI000702ABC5|nr:MULTISPECIES: hypothetical protein [unclassified Phycicoccus]KQU69479.1 hypothetical protein ASC58_06265 [Phycicoccus sp. Root101]KQZ90703.1 hypothetical protein ASD62_16785 [Phycicoccus sp. Root563]
MTQTRIYVPLDADGVRRLAADREVAGTPVEAFAVTERLERMLPSGDEEEWEYAALTEAFEAADERRGTTVAKRVVLAADVDPTWVTSRAGTALSAVQLSQPLPLSRVVSLHVDETAGDEGTDDLLWYDVTELDEVLRLL